MISFGNAVVDVMRGTVLVMIGAGRGVVSAAKVYTVSVELKIV